MKQLLYVSLLFIIGSCVEQDNSNATITYIYHTYNKRNFKTETCNYDDYYKKTIKYREDSIFVCSIFYDENLNVIESRNEVFFKDSFNFYKVNLRGEKKLFFTIKNHNNVFFESKSIYDEGPRDIFLNYNHRYIGNTKLLNQKNKSIEVYKFRVGRSWIKDTRDTINKFLDNEYYYYYTKDFNLFKIEYLGHATYDTWDREEELLGKKEEISWLE